MYTPESIFLSGSTNGEGILVDKNKAPGTTVHAASAIADDYDVVTLFANNKFRKPVKVTILVGDQSDASNKIVQVLQPNDGLKPLGYGLMLKGGEDNEITAYCDTPGHVHIFGSVVRHVYSEGA